MADVEARAEGERRVDAEGPTVSARAWLNLAIEVLNDTDEKDLSARINRADDAIRYALAADEWLASRTPVAAGLPERCTRCGALMWLHGPDGNGNVSACDLLAEVPAPVVADVDAIEEVLSTHGSHSWDDDTFPYGTRCDRCGFRTQGVGLARHQAEQVAALLRGEPRG